MDAIIHFLEDVVHFCAQFGIAATEMAGIGILLITVVKAIIGYFKKDEHIRLDLAEGIYAANVGASFEAVMLEAEVLDEEAVLDLLPNVTVDMKRAILERRRGGQ